MKKLALSVLMTGIFVSTASLAGYAETAKSRIVSAHEQKLIGICKAVQSNSKLRLTLALKEARVSYSEMQEGLVCNGKDPMTFAMLNGAEDNAHLIAKRSGADMSSIVAAN
ncbi:DUF3718 domain-containing protein [Alteromonadaceae bacterium M269]|nr:DUF3718 domain-containing protein [Alteromonadaceae bacterium M269]